MVYLKTTLKVGWFMVSSVAIFLNACVDTEAALPGDDAGVSSGDEEMVRQTSALSGESVDEPGPGLSAASSDLRIPDGYQSCDRMYDCIKRQGCSPRITEPDGAICLLTDCTGIRPACNCRYTCLEQ